MQRTLKQEFEAGWRLPWRKLCISAATVVAVASAWWAWPVSTLRHALANVDATQFEQPYRNRRLDGRPFTSWNWVDASRRTELAASMPKAEETVDVMLRLAAGKSFLFYPSTTQGFVPTARGTLFVTKLGWDKTNGIARDVRGGPVLDLKPYKVTPTVAAIPADRLVDYVTQDLSGRWQFYFTYEGQAPEDNRNSWGVHDPIAALTLLKGPAP